MYRMPTILRLSVHPERKPEPVAAPAPPPEPPVAECAAFIRCCRDSLVPLIDRSVGMTVKELRILKDLRSERGDCAASVAKRLVIDDGEMSRLTARLAAKAWLERLPGLNRRKAALRLTPTGRALVDRSNWAEHVTLEARLQELTVEEQARLREAMVVVTELLCGEGAG